MKVDKKNLEKSQIELTVEMTTEEFAPYIKKGAEKISKEVKIDGFRPGHIPFDVLKQKIGEMTILEEGARIAINKSLDKVITENVEGDPVGQPKIDIVKLAPGNPMVYKVVMAMLPSIELPDYKNANIKEKTLEITEDEVKKAVSEIAEMRASEVLVDREVKDGDKVLVDIEMFLDKVPVEGGQSKGAAIIIGRNYIVSGFDKKLIGAKKGDVKEFSLPYPKEFHMKNLAGKMVDFKVKIKEVYERVLPKMDDDFAKGFGLKKFSELEENIRKSIEDQKKKENSQKVEKEMLEKLIEKAKFGDIPEMLIEHEGRTMMAELEQTITSQGAKFDDYLASISKSREQLTLDLLPEAVKRVKVSVLIRHIAKLENVKVSSDEIEKNVKDMKEHYKGNNDAISRVDTPEYRDYITNVLASRKVIDKLREWNVK